VFYIKTVTEKVVFLWGFQLSSQTKFPKKFRI